MLVTCAQDARRLAKSIKEFRNADSDVFKDITESILNNMSEGIYVVKDGESIDDIINKLERTGFEVNKTKYDDKDAVYITW
jgi:hypothetical protein